MKYYTFSEVQFLLWRTELICNDFIWIVEDIEAPDRPEGLYSPSEAQVNVTKAVLQVNWCYTFTRADLLDQV